jgi:HEPN domain-containing protein
LHSALYVKADTEGLDANDVISVYDNMLKLYAAAWLIFQREGEHPHLKNRKRGSEIIDITQEIGKIRAIDPKPTPAEKLGLDEIRKLLLDRFPSVEMIIHIGTHANPFTNYLLILISDEETTPEHEISNKIEDHCKFLTNVHAIIHKSNSAKVALNIGKRFWCKAISNGNILYQSEWLELPECPEIANEILLERAKFHWERWGAQGNEFLRGAELYRADNNYRLAAFLLHQAVEGILKGIIQAILGYRVQMHNLSRLLRLTLLFTDDLIKVFELDTEEGIQLFSLLQKSYSQSRYNNVFDPDEESVKLLAWRVGAFYKVAGKIFKQYIINLRSPALSQ